MLARQYPNRIDPHPNPIGNPGVTEIVLPGSEQHSSELVLPMLAHLSHQAADRWFTLVGPERLPKDVCERYGFNLLNVRSLASQQDESTLWMVWDALNNGTSAFVVASLQHSSSVKNRERALLEQACLTGQSRALLLKFN